MRLDRKMVYLNAGFLAILGLGFLIQGVPLPASAAGKPWEALASETLLGMTIGGMGLALWFLRRLTQPSDFKRLTLVWLIVNAELFTGLCFLGEKPFDIRNPDAPQLDWRIVGIASIHAAVFLGCCATVVWKRGTEFRRIFQVLLWIEASFSTLAGYGLIPWLHAASLPWSHALVIRALGMELLGLALALAVLGNPAGAGERRRLLLGLGAGNALAAAATLFELRVWGYETGWVWGLALAQAALALGSVWAGRRPERAWAQPTRREMVRRLTWSHLVAGAAAAILALTAPALSLPPWLTLGLAVFLALGASAVLSGDIQRDLLSAAGPFSTGWLAAPEPEGEDAARQTWLRQVSEAAAQEERNRLARDLHDSIKQQIFSIHVSAAAAQARWDTNPEGARAAVADIRKNAQEAMAEMRALLQQLRPRALAGTGLVEALREQCEALGYRSGAEVTLELGDPVPDELLPPGAQETLFRIAQEALSNVARHARARRVRLWLGRWEEALTLRIEDDGQGFDPAAETAGMGLRNLRERAASVRGDLEIASSPGAGTRVAVRVPLIPPPVPAAPPDVSRAGLWQGLLFLGLMTEIFLIGHVPSLWEAAFKGETFLYQMFLVLPFLLWLRWGRRADRAPGVLAYQRHQAGALFIIFFGYLMKPSGAALAPDQVVELVIRVTLIFYVAFVVAAECSAIHKASEIRRVWRKGARIWLAPILALDAAVLLALGTGLLAPQRLSLGPLEVFYLLLAGAVFSYTALRQPRQEGAAS